MDHDDIIQTEWVLEDIEERDEWQWRPPGGRKVGPGPNSEKRERERDLYGIHIEDSSHDP